MQKEYLLDKALKLIDSEQKHYEQLDYEEPEKNWSSEVKAMELIKAELSFRTEKKPVLKSGVVCCGTCGHRVKSGYTYCNHCGQKQGKLEKRGGINNAKSI